MVAWRSDPDTHSHLGIWRPSLKGAARSGTGADHRPLHPPIAPMEALSVDEIPTGGGWQYEPRIVLVSPSLLRGHAADIAQPRAGNSLFGHRVLSAGNPQETTMTDDWTNKGAETAGASICARAERFPVQLFLFVGGAAMFAIACFTFRAVRSSARTR